MGEIAQVRSKAANAVIRNNTNVVEDSRQETAATKRKLTCDEGLAGPSRGGY
ncbi:hypothetical protein FRB93_007156 [Tulasnella sp. JGI-2019a]|nr:hypothetical protein FRB93_007156 [Tulasnella sp. JGI-2019a]